MKGDKKLRRYNVTYDGQICRIVDVMATSKSNAKRIAESAGDEEFLVIDDPEWTFDKVTEDQHDSCEDIPLIRE